MRANASPCAQQPRGRPSSACGLRLLAEISAFVPASAVRVDGFDHSVRRRCPGCVVAGATCALAMPGLVRGRLVDCVRLCKKRMTRFLRARGSVRGQVRGFSVEHSGVDGGSGATSGADECSWVECGTAATFGGVPSSYMDVFADLLIESGADSASVTDPGSKSAALHATFPPHVDPQASIAATVAALGLDDTVVKTDFAVMDSRAWEQSLLASAKPIRLAPGLWAVPSLQSDDAAPTQPITAPDCTPEHDADVVVLSPGLAFGDGAHPTTRLCLDFCLPLFRGRSFLDFGSGSGILSIAAALRGASRCLAVDIDQVAVRAAESNAVRSRVSESVDVRLWDRTASPAEQLHGESFDLVAANIHLHGLRDAAAAIDAGVAAGGMLVVSGVLVEQEAETKALFEEYGFISTGQAEASLHGDDVCWLALYFARM